MGEVVERAGRFRFVRLRAHFKEQENVNTITERNWKICLTRIILDGLKSG